MRHPFPMLQISAYGSLLASVIRRHVKPYLHVQIMIENVHRGMRVREALFASSTAVA